MFVACEEGEWRVGLLGWGAGALGVWGVLGKKTLLPRGSFQKMRISGGSEFCFKIYVERETCVKEGVRVGLEG